MRRCMAAVAAVLTGSVAAGVGVAALPARAAAGGVRAGAGVSAAAGQPSVTVRAIDREGKAVPVAASLDPAVGYGSDRTLTSAHATKVAAGSYNVAAWVWEPGGKAVTLVDRGVTITGSTTVTFDARPGRQLRFTVNDATVAVHGLYAEPFSATSDEPAIWRNSFGPVNGPAVYLVPGPLPTGWDVILQANLVRPERDNAASPVEYELVKTLSGSIPADLTFASTRAGLAQDHVTIRDFGQGGDGEVFSPFRYSGNPSDSNLWGAEFGQNNVRTPASVDVYFSPGYRWESVGFAASDDEYGTQTLRAGRTYAQTFNAAVFSPSPLLGPSVYGSSLFLNQTFGNDLLVDAAGQGAGSESVGLGETWFRPQGWLYRGNTLIDHVSGYGATFSVKIPATTQTYTMKFEETRTYPGNVPMTGLADAVTATYTFRAAAGQNTLVASDFWPRMVPQGVSEKNTAAGGSRTTVPITFDTATGAIPAHDVAVWASVNGGRTWSALKVAHSGSTWTVSVANPKKAGYVSLRVQGEDAAGFKAVVTAYHAYAVS